MPAQPQRPDFLAFAKDLVMSQVSPDIAPFFQKELSEEGVRQASFAREAARCSGVSWGGMDCDAPRSRTFDEILDAATARKARLDAFNRTPRGQLMAALRELKKTSFSEQAWSVQGIYDRNLNDERQPLDVGAAVTALIVLEKTGQAGAEARAALHDLLLNDQRRAA